VAPTLAGYRSDAGGLPSSRWRVAAVARLRLRAPEGVLLEQAHSGRRNIADSKERDDGAVPR
jgi:hypothetical protein